MSSAGDEKLGNIKIADDVIAAFVLEALTSTEGIGTPGGGISDSIPKNLRGKNAQLRGIRINQTEDGVVIDINTVVRYGVKIPEVAWNLQENVKRSVEGLSGCKVKAVNIHVQGVSFEGADSGEEPHSN